MMQGACSTNNLRSVAGMRQLMPKLALLATLFWPCSCDVARRLDHNLVASSSDWDDVCTNPEWENIRSALCPQAFFVSQVAFNPMFPFAQSNVTLILQPSNPIGDTEFIRIYLPGFDPIGQPSNVDPSLLELSVTPKNPEVVGQTGNYNTASNPVFENTALYDTTTGYIRISIRADRSLSASLDTEIQLCCMTLPSSSPANNRAFRIAAPEATGQSTFMAIYDEPILNSPFIDPGFQWEFLFVVFSPPIAQHTTVISLTLRSANDLGDQTQIIIYLSRVTRVAAGSGTVEFNTLNSADVDDWMYFSHLAEWDSVERKLRFFLREGRVLPQGRQITISTMEGDFYLPEPMDANWDDIQVEARSFDNVDEIIKATSVMQSSRIPPVRRFEYTQLVYSNPAANGFTDVTLTFRTNRPMYAGTAIYLRLSGFQAQVIFVPLMGNSRVHFVGQTARFRLPENQLELYVNLTMYSNEQETYITFADLILPPALYENDSSLLIWNSDAGAEHQSIDMSPSVANGVKTFTQAQIKFDPEEPLTESNITFIIRPSIPFYQTDQVMLHLYPFNCRRNHLPMVGPGAHVIANQLAVWDPDNYTLTLTVGTNKIITTTEPLIVGIGMVTGIEDPSTQQYPCRLPDKLSQDDGTLRIEGLGALIHKERLKKVPKIGEDKFVIESRIEFEPAISLRLTRIRILFVLNCDVMPGTTMNMKLGGMLRHVPGLDPGALPSDPAPTGPTRRFDDYSQRSGMISLSGPNAPLFSREAMWNQDDVMLTLQVIDSVWIYSGEVIRFFIENDQNFYLPYAMYANDPSFIIEIREAGISPAPFHFSTKVNEEPKTFIVSEISYGSRGQVAYPGNLVEVNVRFQPNVQLPGGSVIRFTLPGFQLPNATVNLGSMQDRILRGEYDMNNFDITGIWNQFDFTMSFTIPTDKGIERSEVTVFTIPEMGGFQLPLEFFTLNDPRLKIACIANQIIYEESVKESPIVVAREFNVSRFDYLPAVAGSYHLQVITLQPTVNISYGQDIVIYYAPGFQKQFPEKTNIQITGPDRWRIEQSMGQWNEQNLTLTLRIPILQPIPAMTIMELRIAEKEGFQLPNTLDLNDARMQIQSIGDPTQSGANIPRASIKESPMVGNGPFINPRQLYCMYQYEHGVRNRNSTCYCDPPLQNPCSVTELDACNCESDLTELHNLTVQGFNLQQSDQVYFKPVRGPDDGEEACLEGPIPSVLNPFTPPSSQQVTMSGGRISYVGISSTRTGYYEVCVSHVGRVYHIGQVVVRPSCERPLVRVQGICTEHCPKTKVPIAGECRLDPIALAANDNQAVMLPVRMIASANAAQDLPMRPSSDSELKYFIYRYTYELARLLNCDPARIHVASLSNGSLIVNTVFTTVGDETALAATTERSPRALVSLLQALQVDTSSSLYMSQFFRDIDTTYMPEPIEVRQCPGGAYRVFCPYQYDIRTTAGTIAWFLGSVVALPLILVLLCACLWIVDYDTRGSVDEEIYEKVRRNPNLVEPPVQVEYAKSWLEGRFMGEDWEQARHAKLLSVGHHKKS